MQAPACVQLGVTVEPKLLQGVWIAAPYLEQHYDTKNGVRIVDGRIKIPDGAGLGINPDPGAFGEPAASFA